MLERILYNTHDVVLLITVYECLLFATLIGFIWREKYLSNFLLVGFLLSTAAIPLDTLISFGAGVRTWFIDSHPNWFYVFEVGYWIQGPFLLWYVRSLVYKNYSLAWSDLIYLIPFCLYFSHQFIGYHLLPQDFKVYLQQNYDIVTQSSSVFYIVFARELLRVFFGVRCIYELRHYRQQISRRNSQNPVSNMLWLYLLIIGFTAIWLASLVMSVLILYSVESGVPINIDVIGLTSNYIVCALVGVFIVLKSSMFASEQVIERIHVSSTTTTRKYRVSLVQVRNIEEFMEKEKPYLDLTLTLDSLSNQLSMSPRNLSKIINRHYGYNIFEFINKYRIDEAKALLVSEDHRKTSVLDVMYMAGFNSKATFNNSFKKTVGVTPRIYRNSKPDNVLEKDAPVRKRA
ncbi:MAG: AraC-like DNA-binding protein [Flavobacteriales bacterium]|jgi:AraC-like DNA-binding protein